MEDLRYDFSKEVYKNECDRENGLNNKSQIYLSLLTIILSSIIFNIKDVYDLIKMPEFSNINNTIIGVLVSILVTSSIAISMIFLSMRLFEYKNPYLFETLKKFYEKNEYDKKIFDLETSKNYLKAARSNERVNDSKAKFLSYSYFFIILSFILSVVFLTLIITVKK
ncbi:hypothetical protein GCM10011514_41280 [Emticicia aquatilis]|uniref:Uncharacterized protein n=1 Tax=Emticicia aquatilis TaxID=1537369 RepID=A0A916Z1Z5_9BACT|nr:hypothetical protein [Emticicia aquatilis]GGD72923.1 hypothetical protein GCM10011514_41280 [Emticicia aquatilis]